MNAREIAWLSVLAGLCTVEESDVLVSRFRTSLMLCFPARGPRNFIRLGPGHRMTRRRARLADTVKHRPHLWPFRFLWRTLSNHNSASTRFSDQRWMLSPAEIGCQTFRGQNERRETASAFPRRSSYTRLVFISETQASLPRGVLEIILRALVVSTRRLC